MSSAFDRYLSVPARTLRQPSLASGVRPSAPATKIPNLFCMALVPASAEVRLQTETDAPMRLFETYVKGDLDIRAGDILVISSSSVQYQIKGAEPWTWSDNSVFLHLILEKANT